MRRLRGPDAPFAKAAATAGFAAFQVVGPGTYRPGNVVAEG